MPIVKTGSLLSKNYSAALKQIVDTFGFTVGYQEDGTWFGQTARRGGMTVNAGSAAEVVGALVGHVVETNPKRFLKAMAAAKGPK